MKTNAMITCLTAVLVLLSAEAAQAVTATGGNSTNRADGYIIHTFTSDGTLTVTDGGGVEYLVVGGGGSGGSGFGGGGGAGGMLTGTATVGVNTFTIVVGNGGTAVAGTVGNDGSDSSFGPHTATGGGGGGNYSIAGSTGGSGGGGGGQNTTSGGTATAHGSNGGGCPGADQGAGGGGGAGEAGQDGQGATHKSGRGGDGLASSISGTSTYYAQGGCGFWANPGNNANRGGGGNSVNGVAAESGTANTGGGGGADTGTGGSSGAGGSGIVIVRYLAPPRVINVDVNADDTYAGKGAVEDSGTTWNVYNHNSNSGTISDLTASDDTATDVDLSISGNSSPYLINSGDSDNGMHGDYVYTDWNVTANWTLSGLETNKAYDLYFYGSLNAIYTANAGINEGVVSASITSAAFMTALAPDHADWINGTHYAVMRVTPGADSAGTISGTFTSLIQGNQHQSILSGVQIVERSFTVNSGTLTPFTGGDAGEGLDLTGDIVYAFNLGGPDQTVQGVTFVAASVGTPPAGISHTGSPTDFDYYSANGNSQAANYGATANDTALEDIVTHIWYDPNFTIDLTTVPGTQYKLQLILQEGFQSVLYQGATSRNFDISVETASPSTVSLAVENLILGIETDGGAAAQPGTDFGLVYTYTFTAADTSFRVQLDDALGADNNCILAAVTLEELSLFTGGDAGEGLDLDGDFVYAVNLGGPEQTVQGVTFAAGYAASLPAGITTTGSPTDFDYATAGDNGGNQAADYGDTANDTALEDIVTHVLYDPNWTLDLATESGTQYKLQLILQEAWYSNQGGTDRNFDVSVETASPSVVSVVLDDLILGQETDGGAAAQPGADYGLVYTHTFVAADDSFRVQLDDVAGGDANCILSAMTLEEIPSFTDFSTDPDITNSWDNHVQLGSAGTATWNSGDEDLDLLAPEWPNYWNLLSRTDATRGADESVTMDVTSLSASSTREDDWTFVGLTISSTETPGFGDGTPLYTFRILGAGADIEPNTVPGRWQYNILDGANNSLFTSASSFEFTPVTMGIRRDGDEYDFLVDGSTIFASSGTYTEAQNDAMVNYHIAWGSGTFTALNATVDNFGIGEPPPVGSMFLFK
ncbi:MAG: hypothetical protein HN341_07710 [Verrucomicrobia bacterium]|jgi:hypothetical protein|nr:hypothetical protein [Verrucomicrobiota bacterium]